MSAGMQAIPVFAKANSLRKLIDGVHNTKAQDTQS